MRLNKVKIGDYVRPVGIIPNDNGSKVRFMGTAFGAQRPGLVVTAKHVVGNTPLDRIYLESKGKRLQKPCEVRCHPSEDIAVLNFANKDVTSFFTIASPPDAMEDFYLGTDVQSYGYPSKVEGPCSVSLEPSLIKGSMQRMVGNEYEFSFPVYEGQSGSPVLLVDDVEKVMAMLVRNVDQERPIDWSRDTGPDDLPLRTTSRIVSYGFGLALWRFRDWIQAGEDSA